MTNKTFNMLSFAVLALLVLTSFASAVTIDSTNATQFAQNGNTIITVNYSGATVGNTLTTAFTAATDPTGKNVTFTVAGIPATLTATSGSFTIATTIPTGFDFSVKQYTTKLTLTEKSGTTTVLPEATKDFTFAQTAFCAWDSNTYDSTKTADLTIEIKDVTVTSGYGEDNEWYPEDSIEVEIEVKNEHNDYHMKDITVEWGIFDKTNGEWALKVADENDFSLKDGEKVTKTLTFKLDDLDEDFAELGSLVFYARATGKVDDDASGYTLCASDSEDVSMTSVSDFVILQNIQLSEPRSCGSSVQVKATVWNIGDSDQEGVYALVTNKELGINEKVVLGDIDAFEDNKFEALIKVPQNAEEKTYPITITLYNEDGDVYESDDEDEATFTVQMPVVGGCSNAPLVTVAASIQSEEVKAGQELVVKATIVNTGTVQKTFNVEVNGYSEWAESASLDKTSITLASKASSEVLITLKVKADATGAKTFDIIAKDGDKALAQPYTVNLEEAPTLISKIKELVKGSGNDNWYLWGIGALNVILVLVIIFVAIKVVKGKK